MVAEKPERSGIAGILCGQRLRVADIALPTGFRSDHRGHVEPNRASLGAVDQIAEASNFFRGNWMRCAHYHPRNRPALACRERYGNEVSLRDISNFAGKGLADAVLQKGLRDRSTEHHSEVNRENCK